MVSISQGVLAMDMLKCCLNPRVLIGAGVVGVGILLIAPNLLAAALPTLLVLICPASMLLMMLGMGKMGSSKNATQTVVAGGDYSCPMHPAVHSAMPGRCSQCGMTLVASTSPAARPQQSLVKPSWGCFGRSCRCPGSSKRRSRRIWRSLRRQAPPPSPPVRPSRRPSR
ncbi:MAG: DUF2933 domain-containing protein [Chloroflexi bacterium]|nr:MAG: DUF2933 domain-containing protein [Chloroflexota bacterium]